GIKDSSDPFLKFLDKLQIQLGSTLKVISKEPFDNSMLVKTETASISISNQISKNIFVKKL
ncbi:MAG: FeoA family protein, partial [Lutibacter sp.]